MLKIYDTNHNAIGHIVKYKDLKIEGDVTTGDRTLSFTYMARHHEICEEFYIETQDDEYVVKEKGVSTDGFLSFVAVLNLEELEAKPWSSFSIADSTISDAAKLALAGSGWTVGECTVTKKRNAGILQTNTLGVIQKLCTAFMCEVVYDTKKKTVSFYEQVGQDKGTFFLTGLDLKRLQRKGSSYDYYTRIIPIGQDGLTVESVNDGKNYLENYQYTKKVKTYIWKDEFYTDAAALKEDAEAKLKDLSKPEVSYSADIINLAKQKAGYSGFSFSLGDTITLIDAATGIREKQRIIKLTQYPQNHTKDECELANKLPSFEEAREKLQAAQEIINTVISDDGRYTGTINVSDILHFEEGVSGSGAVGNLQGLYNALNGDLSELKVSVGQIETNYIKAEDADLKYATIKKLEVEQEKVKNLDVLYGNIKNLLSGAAGIGELQNIHLTSQNAVLEEALIKNAVIQYVSVGDLQAGTILTSKFTIMDPDGGLLIKGPTAQWSDKNGNVRIQIGQDVRKNFTFSLFDETGTGVLIDSTGIKEKAIADGLIVNKMVSDDAAIAGTKLDIPSVVLAINGSDSTIKSSRIWMDESGQSLNQMYTRLDQNITVIDQSASEAKKTAAAANSTASAAADTAQQALSVLSGISTLDALGASLDNDSHVVHTNTDGSGGDYSDCYTRMTVYLGDTDVSYDAVFEVAVSEGVSGNWNAKLRTYYVKSMSTDDGYVDIEAVYGSGERYLTTRSGLRLTTRSGAYLTAICGGSRIKKRFSISKAKDGKIGINYNLRASVLAIRKQKDGKTLIPASVTFSALELDNGTVHSYTGRYKVEESTDGINYTVKYQPTADELQKVYTPSSSDIKAIRATLYAAGSSTQELDSQTVIVLADAEGLSSDIAAAQKTADQAKEAIATTQQNVTKIESSVKGFEASLKETNSELQGVTDGTLLYNIRYLDNGNDTTTLYATVYQKGKDVTKNYPDKWFTWRRKTESGEYYLGYGYQITVQNKDYEFGGACAGRFTTYDTYNLTTKSGKYLTTRSGKQITIWREN